MIAPLLVDAETPRSLVLNPPLTDAEFEALCFSSDWFRFERTREGEILRHPPMERWLENGVSLGWLIDPYKKKVHVYEPARKVFTISGKTVRGTGPVEGFSLDLEELWHCYEI